MTAEEQERVKDAKRYTEAVKDSVIEERFALRNARGQLYANQTQLSSDAHKKKV